MYVDSRFREFKSRVAALAASQIGPIGLRQIRGVFRVELTVGSPEWITKKHTVRQRDLDNSQKVFLDAVCSGIGIEDSRIWELNSRKAYTRQASISIRFFALGDLIDLEE